MAGENADAAGAIAKRRIVENPRPQEEDAYPVVDEMPQPPCKVLWNAPGEDPFILPISSSSRSQFLEDRVMLADPKACMIACRQIRPGEVAWTVDLRKHPQNAMYHLNPSGRVGRRNSYHCGELA